VNYLTYDELQVLYESEITIVEADLHEVKGLKGLYIDGCVAIDKHLTETEKSCVLAEEIGHHLTTSGNILDQTKVVNKKQELKARLVAYDIKVGLAGIIKSYEAGCKNIYEMSCYLDVTEDFLKDALKCYRKKYGVYIKIDSYIIYFEPYLGIMKLLEGGDFCVKI
jgi:hypothetical protein